MSNFERKFGRYAIRNLSSVLIGFYILGYVILAITPGLMNYLTLDPYRIIHGQVWRLVTWLLNPPTGISGGSDILFVGIMLFFYYSIGTSLERVWGTYRYNVFILTGVLLTVGMAFLWMIFCFILGIGSSAYIGEYFASAALQAFSTYYISMSIFLAYALTFPEAQVLLMFIIPVKVKWLGIVDLVYLLYCMLRYPAPYRFAIAAALINILILWLKAGGWMRISPAQVRRRNSFRRSVKSASQSRTGAKALHRCAICGRTDQDNPNLEFRYCSKCEGGYEYCTDHLFTHVHVKAGERPHIQAPGR
ncbi:MAG: hypothetical protein IIU47_00725 [Lachnospiraceae bacterium]|nr:hypothetical protein [Lachnospiraceae bacterium]